jgi:hypothetical protein
LGLESNVGVDEHEVRAIASHELINRICSSASDERLIEKEVRLHLNAVMNTQRGQVQQRPSRSSVTHAAIHWNGDEELTLTKLFDGDFYNHF